LLRKMDNPDAPAERLIMDWHFIARASAWIYNIRARQRARELSYFAKR
jgi:hypothetical protein